MGDLGVPAPTSTSAGIPKIIWMLWFQGWDQAPEVCLRCRTAFELWNPGWEIRALSEADLPAVLGADCGLFSSLCEALNPLAEMNMSWIPPAGAADVLRTFLLSRYGGVWADSTILCRKPLDDWIHEAAAAAGGFFAYSPEKTSEIPVMSSFLASVPRHPIVEAWMEAMTNHWLQPKASRPDLGYFWLHVLFGKIVEEDSASKKLWARARKVSGEYGVPGPHQFVPYEETLARPPTSEIVALINDKEGEPLYKMTIHDVKYRRGSPTLLNKEGKQLIKVADSAYEYILRAVLEKAKTYSAAATKQTDGGPTSCGLSDAWRNVKADELEKFRSSYRLKIASQPMMPSG